MAGSTVHTDELKSYNGLSKAGFEHKTVNHGAGEYVDGDSHVNGIEGFWARLKLSIRGTHVHVSPKHLQNYVKEFEYRYNRRKRPTQFSAIWWRTFNNHRVKQGVKPSLFPRCHCSA